MSYYEQTTEYPTEIPEGLGEHDLPENTTKSSPASSKSLWQSFCLSGLDQKILAILHQPQTPTSGTRKPDFLPTLPPLFPTTEKPDYWFPHIDFSFAFLLLYVPFFDKCSLQLINAPLSSYSGIPAVCLCANVGKRIKLDFFSPSGEIFPQSHSSVSCVVRWYIEK
ncbi:hypothetical protein CDAR_564411 [Caerostris darwini]|uniref:Uncharacterized protein n=1 Tax=Caerostris darwini TaxID=1538125 RepID=A0AAV4TKV5_9ARAC|nr:hypothetical protein CDAR_564411 [Caerostris darwini]